MYAVNLCDLTARKDDFCLQMAIQPIIDLRGGTINCESGRIDGASIPLHCDDERAAAIVKVVRMHYKKHQMRIYRRNGGRWRRV